MSIMQLKQVHIWLLLKSRMLSKIAFAWECHSNIVSCLSNIITECPPMMLSTLFSDDLLTNQNLEVVHNKMEGAKDQLPEVKLDTTILCIQVLMHAVVKSLIILVFQNVVLLVNPMRTRNWLILTKNVRRALMKLIGLLWASKWAPWTIWT